MMAAASRSGTAAPHATRPAATPALQRAQGVGRLEARLVDGRTRLDTLFQEGAAKIRLPNTFDASLEAVLINTAGGLTGGDALRWQMRAAAGTRLVLTTPACERIYKSTGPDARIATSLVAGPGAWLEWLPQETILFERARLSRTIDVELAPDSRFLAVEAVILGRAAMGEAARDIRLSDRWRIRRSGRLVHAEATRITGAAVERDGSALLDGAGAFATLLYIGPDAELRHAAIASSLAADHRAGCSLMGERLVVRAVAASGLALRRIIVPVIAMMGGAGVPRLWRL
jgi:urease accessory protein